MSRKLTVRRKGYHRQGYRRKDGTYVKPSYVPPTTFRIRDVGKRGRGPKLIKVKKGKMTELAIRLGYIEKGQRISDIPMHRIDDFARDAVEKIGKKRALGMFRAQITFRKRLPDGFKDKMERAFESAARM